MKVLSNEPLAPYTSLRVGGPAENLIIAETKDETESSLQSTETQPWLLGYGCNILIGDKGLRGTTILWRGGSIAVEGDRVTADAGTWWDDVVIASIENGLWGLEIMSQIPSSTGGAVFGNIAAYGGQISDTLDWIEIYDLNTKKKRRYSAKDLEFSYRKSSLQTTPWLVILQVSFKLKKSPIHTLKYESALAIAREKNLNPNQLSERRDIVIETRRRAGSLYSPLDPNPERTAGSFFKNPLVSFELAKELAKFDESGKTLERIIEQNTVHGGSPLRTSASYVLLASGFQRGQKWDKVMLHPSHVLKVTTLPGATAQEVYSVTKEIQKTVKDKLSIEIEPEVRFIGEF